jgi:hypothetical protein
MLEGLREILRLREAFVFDFDQMIIDHHVGAANAIEKFKREDEEAPPPKVIQCWAHISRQAIGGRHWDNPDNKKMAEEHMSMLHFCRTEAMFDMMSRAITSYWEGRFIKEPENAEWLRKTYLTPTFKRWWYNCCEIPGIIPENNETEAAHRDDERDNFGQGNKVKVQTGTFIQESIPRQLEKYANQAQDSISLTADDMLPNHIMHKAKRLLATTENPDNPDEMLTNWIRMDEGFVFRASGFMWQDNDGNTINEEGAMQYLAARNGLIQTSLISKMSKICYGYHLVTFTTKMDPETGETFTDYVCDCKGFAGQVECSHITAAQALEDEICLDDLTAKIIPGRRGRKETNRDPIPKLADADQHVVGPLSSKAAEAQYGEKVAIEDDGDILIGNVTSQYNIMNNNM